MREFVSGNIFFREMCLATVGSIVHGHQHAFDHTTYCIKGAVRIEKLSPDGVVVQSIEKRAHESRPWALIKAGVTHRITALEDNSIAHCIYSHRVPMGLVDNACRDAEYDALLARLMALADERYPDVVQAWTGWEAGTL